jgi:hypothetical protein
MSWRPKRLAAIRRNLNKLRREIRALKAERRGLEEACDHREYDKDDRCIACRGLVDDRI